VVKLRYEKLPGDDLVRYTIVETEPVEDDTELDDPETYRHAFTMITSDSPGETWTEPVQSLPGMARALARFNNRKNICSTEAGEGVLY